MSDTARLILLAPSEENTTELCARLAPLVEAVPFDAVILPVMGGDDRARINHAKSVAAIVQNQNAALLLMDSFELVARTGADGVHLTNSVSLAEALSVLKPLDRIVGVAGLKARHDAMEAAEAGADYVMFGEHAPMVRCRQRQPCLSAQNGGLNFFKRLVWPSQQMPRWRYRLLKQALNLLPSRPRLFRTLKTMRPRSKPFTRPSPPPVVQSGKRHRSVSKRDS